LAAIHDQAAIARVLCAMGPLLDIPKQARCRASPLGGAVSCDREAGDL
jgi:hypothetical protein